MTHQNPYEANPQLEQPTSLLPGAPELPPHAPIMDDVYGVGPDKPLGYLPIETIYGSGEHPETVADLSRERGLSTLTRGAEESKVRSGALYVYDEKALGSLLAEHAQVLAASGWPTDPTEFAQRVSTEGVDPRRDPNLFKVIAWAYRDPRPEYQRPSPTERPKPSGSIRSRIKRLGSLAFRK